MSLEEPKKNNFTSKYLSPCRTIGLKRKSKSPGNFTPNKKSNKFNDVADEEDVNNQAKVRTDSLDLVESDVPDNKALNRIERSQTTCSTLGYSLQRLKSSCFIDNTLNDSNIEESKAHCELSNRCSIDTKIKSLDLEIACSPEKECSVNSSQSIVNTPKSAFSKNTKLASSQSKPFMKTSRNSVRSDSNPLSSKIPKHVMDVILRINEKHKQLQHFKNNKVYSEKHDIKKLTESTERWKQACIEVLERLHSELQARGDSTTTLSDLIRAHSIPPDLLSFDMESQEFI